MSSETIYVGQTKEEIMRKTLHSHSVERHKFIFFTHFMHVMRRKKSILLQNYTTVHIDTI